jgi:hypothetical protein
MHGRFIVSSSSFNRRRIRYQTGDLQLDVGVQHNDVTIRGIRMATLALALVLSAYTLAWSLDGEDRAASSVTPVEVMAEFTADVPGVDVPGLPRYPGSARVEYNVEVANGLATTQARYAVTAEIDAVREFYRQVFRSEGWSEVDVRFSRGRWTFLVVSGEREARVRIKSRGALVEITLGLSEPTMPAAGSALLMPLTASTASNPPPPDRIGIRLPESW